MKYDEIYNTYQSKKKDLAVCGAGGEEIFGSAVFFLHYFLQHYSNILRVHSNLTSKLHYT